MKTSLRNKPRISGKKAWLAVFAIIVILGATNNSARMAVSRLVLFVSLPFLNVGNLFLEGGDEIFSLFKNKKNITEELDKTRERIRGMETAVMETEILKKENIDLKKFFSQSDKKSYILGSIISRPPRSPYDTMIIDAGSENGAANGMRVLVYSNIFAGYVAETFPNYSKVKLLSFPGEETGVSIISDNRNISASAIGAGGGNMEVRLPDSIKLIQESKITTEETFPLVIGMVETIELDDNSSFQKIKFRLPVNFNEIKNVFIEK